MRKNLILVLFIVLMLNGCASKNKEDVIKDIIIGSCDIDLGGESYKLGLYLSDGEYFFNEDPGPYYGDNWIGEFTLILYREVDDNTISRYKLKDNEMTFNKKFEIMISDYNDDGVNEFLIGQYGSANFNVYRMYYIDENLNIGYYNQLGEILMSDESMSPLLNEDCIYKYYDNRTGDFIEKKIDFNLLDIKAK
jgi:hypothetical protein